MHTGHYPTSLRRLPCWAALHVVRVAPPGVCRQGRLCMHASAHAGVSAFRQNQPQAARARRTRMHTRTRAQAHMPTRAHHIHAFTTCIPLPRLRCARLHQTKFKCHSIKSTSKAMQDYANSYLCCLIGACTFVICVCARVACARVCARVRACVRVHFLPTDTCCYGRFL
jgi:hypothetical protein